MSNQQIYMNSALLEMLHKLPVFDAFSAGELRRILYSGKVLRIEKFSPEDVVIQEGSFGRWVYVLIKGAVKVLKDGAEISRLSQQGDIIGEIGAIRSEMRSATVIALEDSIFFALDISVIEHMSGAEAQEYLQRLQNHLAPLIRQRLSRTIEIAGIMQEVRKKRTELEQMETRLRELGVTEEKSILQLLLEGDTGVES